MQILVPTKRVPDPDQKIRLAPDSLSIADADTSQIVNPFDVIALEEAVRIRERLSVAVTITVLGIGGDEYENQLRTGLAMGADRALLVHCKEALDPWNVGQLLAAVVRRDSPDLVLMGKQAVDDDANQTGQMLAAILNWPQATFASRIEILDGRTSVRVARETDAGLETVRVRLPAVITADLRLNEPRYASLPAMIKARKKPIERIAVSDLGVTLEPRVQVLRLERSMQRRSCVRVKDVDELVDRLRHEAKVI